MTIAARVRESSSAREPTAAWAGAWVGICGVAIANGAIRRTTYGKRMSDLHAHQLATATLVPAIYLCAMWVQRRRPLPSTRSAVSVGAAWATTTLMFEFGFGHVVGREPWEKLIEAYDVRSGHVWIAVPAAMFSAPLVARGVAGRSIRE